MGSRLFFNPYMYIKRTALGTVEWVARLTGAGSGDTIWAMTCDSGSNLYVAGYYGATLTAYNADQTTFATTLALVGGTSDVFLIKYNSTGNVQWVARMTSTGNDVGYAVSCDSQENVYVGGFYGATLTAYNADQTTFATTLASVTAQDGFLIKYNSSGSVQWVARQTGTGTNDGIFGIDRDSQNNLYIVGNYNATLTAWNAAQTSFATTLTTVSIDAFLIKYNSSGVVQWVAKISSNKDDVARAVAVDSTDAIYVAGYYSSTGVLTAYNADQTAFATTLAIATVNDVFIAKYNSSGSVQWVARMAGAGTDNAYACTIDSQNNLYVTGQYGVTGSLTAYNANQTAFATTLASASSSDIFVAKYNSSGSVQWVARMAAAGGGDIGYGVSCDSSDYLYVSGSYGSAALTIYNADQTAFATTLPSASDSFLVKYDSTGLVQWVSRLGSAGTDIGRCCATDSNGSTYVGGSYAGTTTAYNANGTAFATTLAIATSTDCFLVKYS